jgi:hypothetical protein
MGDGTMKNLIASILLLGAFAVNAEVITVKLPKAGTFLVNLVSPSPCMASEYSLVSKDIKLEDSGYVINVVAEEIDVLYGRAQWCNGNLVANGVYIITSATELNIELPEYFKAPKIAVTEVVKTLPVE